MDRLPRGDYGQCFHVSGAYNMIHRVRVYAYEPEKEVLKSNHGNLFSTCKRECVTVSVSYLNQRLQLLSEFSIRPVTN